MTFFLAMFAYVLKHTKNSRKYCENMLQINSPIWKSIFINPFNKYLRRTHFQIGNCSIFKLEIVHIFIKDVEKWFGVCNRSLIEESSSIITRLMELK